LLEVGVAKPLEVVHIGSACRDVDADDRRGWRLGGGVTYAALTTARLGLRTAAVVGVDAAARSAHELDELRAAGVDLLMVPLDEGPIYHNVETPAGRVQTCVQPGVELPVVPLPESWLHAAAWSIVPVAGEIGDAWAAVVPETAVVGLAWQGLLRRLVAGERVTPRPPRSSPLLQRADLVGVSHHDLDRRTPLDELVRFLRPGAQLLVTRGDHGGLLVTVGPDGPATTLRYLPTATYREVDPTGAGDTFLAALLASAIRPSIAGRHRSRRPLDLRFAAAAGSLVVEGPGLSAVPDRAAVNVRAVRERVRRAIVPAEDAQVGEDAPP
jgi:sugar/nucleoside kinase (ribokinase family)